MIAYTFYPEVEEATGIEVEHLESYETSPHTYDRGRTGKAFIKYLALFVFFTVVRNWLIAGVSPVISSGNKINEKSPRMHHLLWAVSISSATLALTGIIQKLDGTDKLLWLFRNHLKDGFGSFGPFPYQGSAAQFLNLMWPIVFGFWWLLWSNNLDTKKPNIWKST